LLTKLCNRIAPRDHQSREERVGFVKIASRAPKENKTRDTASDSALQAMEVQWGELINEGDQIQGLVVTVEKVVEVAMLLYLDPH